MKPLNTECMCSQGEYSYLQILEFMDVGTLRHYIILQCTLYITVPDTIRIFTHTSYIYTQHIHMNSHTPTQAHPHTENPLYYRGIFYNETACQWGRTRVHTWKEPTECAGSLQYSHATCCLQCQKSSAKQLFASTSNNNHLFMKTLSSLCQSPTSDQELLLGEADVHGMLRSHFETLQGILGVSGLPGCIAQ